MQVINTVNDANGVTDQDAGVWREYIVEEHVTDGTYIGGNAPKDVSDCGIDTSKRDIERFNELIATGGIFRVELSGTTVFVSKRRVSSWTILDPIIRAVIATW